MRQTRTTMGMPATVEIVGGTIRDIDAVFDFFQEVDERFSTYKPTSEISRINRGELSLEYASDDMLEIFERADATRLETNGFFDIRRPDGTIDPSGIVKGWAIQKAARLIEKLGFDHYWVEAGGDIQTSGQNAKSQDWKIGIRNPFAPQEIVKILAPKGRGIATSGTYIRGAHIYDPHTSSPVASPFVSLTVVGTNVYEADRIATAAFAMGSRALDFIEKSPSFEAYAIDSQGSAFMTSGLSDYTYSV